MKNKLLNILVNILKVLFSIAVHIAIIVLCVINQYWLVLSMYAGLTIVGLIIVIMYIYHVFKDEK